MILTK